MSLGLPTYSSDPHVGVGIDRVLGYTYWNVDGTGIVILARGATPTIGAPILAHCPAVAASRTPSTSRRPTGPSWYRRKRSAGSPSCPRKRTGHERQRHRCYQ